MALMQADLLNLDLELERQLIDNNMAEGLIEERNRRRRRRRREVWRRQWLQRHSMFWQFENLMGEMRLEDVSAFRNFVRAEP